MKKVLSALLAVTIIAFMFVSCSEISSDGTKVKGKTAFNAYNDSFEKISTLVNYEYKVEQRQEISVAGVSTNYCTVETAKRNGNNIYSVVTSDVQLISGETTVIFVDDWYYIVNDGQKMKANMSYDEFIKVAYGEDAASIFGNYLVEFPEEWLSNVKFVKTEDNNEYKCSFDVDGEAYMAMLSDAPLLKNIIEGTGMDMSITQFSCDIYYDKNLNMKRIEQQLEFSVDLFGYKGTDVINQTVEISNIGGVGEITAPSDADEYTDITSVMSFGD